MQAKHLIIISVAGIVLLLGFNLINGSLHEKNRAAVLQNGVATDEASVINADSPTSNDIASKPLGEQPKAILDDATSKIDQAQQAEQARVAQINNSQ